MLMAMLLIAAQAQAGAGAPSAAAVALGERLARTGTLATLLPLQTAKETDELIAAHPELSAADQATLRATARATADRMAARAFAVEGRRYAELLSEADLRQLVANAESPAAQRMRAAMPQVMAAVIGGMAGIDYKKDVMGAFCTQTGKGCPAR